MVEDIATLLSAGAVGGAASPRRVCGWGKAMPPLILSTSLHIVARDSMLSKNLTCLPLLEDYAHRLKLWPLGVPCHLAPDFLSGHSEALWFSQQATLGHISMLFLLVLPVLAKTFVSANSRLYCSPPDQSYLFESLDPRLTSPWNYSVLTPTCVSPWLPCLPINVSVWASIAFLYLITLLSPSAWLHGLWRQGKHLVWLLIPRAKHSAPI